MKFADEDKVLILLDTLRASAMYQSLVMTLMWGKETLELEEVIDVLLNFHLRKYWNRSEL